MACDFPINYQQLTLNGPFGQRPNGPGSDTLYAFGCRYCFTPLTGVLFTFPSRYWFTIGHFGVFSLTGWSRRIHAGFLVSRITRVSDGRVVSFRVHDYHVLWSAFPNRSANLNLCNSTMSDPTTPRRHVLVV